LGHRRWVVVPVLVVSVVFIVAVVAIGVTLVNSPSFAVFEEQREKESIDRGFSPSICMALPHVLHLTGENSLAQDRYVTHREPHLRSDAGRDKTGGRRQEDSYRDREGGRDNRERRDDYREARQRDPPPREERRPRRDDPIPAGEPCQTMVIRGLHRSITEEGEDMT